MKSRFDTSQDITLWLTEEEEAVLLSGPTRDFFQMSECSKQLDENNMHYILLRAVCKELDAYISLGYSEDSTRIFSEALDMDGFGRIRIPDQPGLPWRVNLSSEGIEHFTNGWSYGIRYDGEHKLFIFGNR